MIIYKKFKPWMIGQPVRDIDTDDIGIIVGEYCTVNGYKGARVYWTTGDDAGLYLHILFQYFEILSSRKTAFNPQFTVNGIEYKKVEPC